MMAPELSAEDRDVLRGRLAELRRAEAAQVQKLRPLLAESDRVGIDRLPWAAVVEMAARSELLRRLHEQIADGCGLLGIPFDPNTATH